LLDESHFIDLMLWLFGVPERIFARIGKVSDLEIDTDDVVDISIERNDMFLGVAREFLNMLNGRGIDQTCTLADGLRTLEVVDACRESQRTRCEVVLPGMIYV
jgi:predicted dehydrogenase